MRTALHPLTLAAILLTMAALACAAIAAHLRHERQLLQVDLMMDCALLADESDDCDREKR